MAHLLIPYLPNARVARPYAPYLPPSWELQGYLSLLIIMYDAVHRPPNNATLMPPDNLSE